MKRIYFVREVLKLKTIKSGLFGNYEKAKIRTHKRTPKPFYATEKEAKQLYKKYYDIHKEGEETDDFASSYQEEVEKVVESKLEIVDGEFCNLKQLKNKLPYNHWIEFKRLNIDRE